MKVVIPGIHQTDNSDNQITPIGDLRSLQDECFKSLDILDCMDYIQENERVEFLKIAISKLERGGKIKLCGLDFILLGKFLFTCSDQSPSSKIYRGRQSISSAGKEKEILKSLGLRPIMIVIEQENYFIEAVK